MRKALGLVGPAWFEAYLLLFLLLLMSDASPFPPRALVVYASIPLAALGILRLRGGTPSLRFYCVALVLMSVYQNAVLGQHGMKPTLMTLAVFLVVTHYQQAGILGMRRLTLMVALLFAASFLLLVATVMSDTALSLRAWLYRGVEWKDASMTESLWQRQGGLAATAFFLSYQVAAGLALFVSEAASGKTGRRLFWGSLTGLGCLALILCSERSPIVAVAVAIAGLVFFGDLKGRTACLFLLLTAVYFPLSPVISEILELRGEHVISRLEGETGLSDVGARLQLQLWAASQIPHYPLGTILHGVSYERLTEESAVELADAPHNGYITRTLSFGWPLGAIAVVVLARIWKMARVVRSREFRQAVPVLLALAAALVNACFHNASFLSFQPETLVLMMLFAGLFDVQAAGLAKPSGRSRAEPQRQSARSPRKVPSVLALTPQDDNSV